MVSSISRRELIRKFRTLGYSGPFSGGKHQFMVRAEQKIRIPNPHKGEIGVGLLKEILRWDVQLIVKPDVHLASINHVFNLTPQLPIPSTLRVVSHKMSMKGGGESHARRA